MKTLALFLALLSTASAIQSQEPLSRADALRALYPQYDDTNKTAHWVCPKNADKDYPCWQGEDATVAITLLLAAEVNEDGIQKTYVVASARPIETDHYQCHACGPAISVAVFASKANQWVLQSKNEAAGFFGSFGEPGDVSLVAVGPHRYGVTVSAEFGGQGYYEAKSALLLPIAADVTEVLRVTIRQDDEGIDDGPERRRSNRLRYLSKSAMTFFYSGEPEDGYYAVSVISHRTSYRIRTHWVQQKYWEDTYKFNGTKYARISHHQVSKITNQLD